VIGEFAAEMVFKVATRQLRKELSGEDAKVPDGGELANGPPDVLRIGAEHPWQLPARQRSEGLGRGTLRDLAKVGTPWVKRAILAPGRRQPCHRERRDAGSLFDFVAMHQAGAIDIAQPDVAKAGGISELIKIAHYCDANGLTFSPHCALFGPGQIATLHLTAARRRPPLFERLYLDLETELFGDAAVVVDGHLTVPRRPGLGVDPDPAVVARHQK
jgi:hypothetical protein